MTTLELPGPSWRDPLSRRSPCLFSFDAADLVRRPTLTARTGQAATFSRAGPAYGRDGLGRLLRAVHSQPRIVAAPNGASSEPALLLERAATNGCAAPEDFSDAAWTKTNLTVSANALAAPVAEDLVLADRLLETAATGAHQVSDAVTFTANTPQSARIHVRPNGRTRCKFVLANGADQVGVDATLTGAGSAVVVEAGAGDATHVACRAMADGWYELEWSGTLNAASTSGSLVLAVSDGSSYNYAGDVAKGIDAWGAFLDTDQFRPSTYPGAARLADALHYDFLAPPQALTLYARFVLRDSLVTSRGLVDIGGATGGSVPRIILYTSGNGSTLGVTHSEASGAVNGLVAGSPSPVAGDWVELRGVVTATGAVYAGISVAAGTEVVGATSAALALASAFANPRLDIGAYTANPGINALRVVRVLPGERTMAECRGSY